jgi:hypothetical protein
MPKPVGSSPLLLVRLCLRGDRNSGWVLGPYVAKVVERLAGNKVLKVLDVSFNNAGDVLAQALGLVLAHQAGLASSAEEGGLEELNWDGNNTSLTGYIIFVYIFN